MLTDLAKPGRPISFPFTSPAPFEDSAVIVLVSRDVSGDLLVVPNLDISFMEGSPAVVDGMPVGVVLRDFVSLARRIMATHLSYHELKQ
jgi:hypothetical protein